MPSASGLAVLGELGDLAGIDVLNPRASDWKIMNGSSDAIVPDTVPRFEYRNESRVADYPMEEGAFVSYNKVATPFEIRMTMVCSGSLIKGLTQGVMNDIIPGFGNNNYTSSRDGFLAAMENMLQGTEVYTIVTPDMTYNNATLEHYDYRKESNNGAVMLIVEAWFREVRVTASAVYSNTGQPNVNSASPSAANPADVGSVHPGDSVTVDFGPAP